MRELTLTVTCDGCHEHFAEDDVVNVEFKVGRQIYEVDLCAVCIGSRLTSISRPLRRTPGRNKKVEDIPSAKPARKPPARKRVAK